MPIHEHGYRHWEGELAARPLRWLAITRSGIRTALRVRWTRMMLIGSLAPVLYFGLLLFALGKVTDPHSEASRMAQGIVAGFLEDPLLAARLEQDPSALRGPLWNDIFLALQSKAQIALACLMSLVIAPSLISRDVKSKAFLIYFSKPITRVDYLLGKAGVLAGFLAWVTLLPSLLIYLIGIATSPDAATFGQTAEVLPRIVLGAAVIIVPLTLVGLLISALNSEERIARFMWLVILLVGQLTYRMFFLANPEWESPLLFSLGKTIEVAVFSVYDDPVAKVIGNEGNPTLALAWLGALSLASLAIIWRRISAPMRV